ncbi:MAG: hypothetical protein JRI23_14385 [Deltaproteobacteria bacterium]|jgi:hypothetical protein|nr:hypothetical protein [Deltaproteobacteria bacterium]MBW2532933.1 hypothetical protein [Deltaproteobacteria bacterium]
MDRYRLAFYGTAAALAVSLVVHVRAAWEEPTAGQARRASDATATAEPSNRAAAPSATATAQPASSECSRCQAALTACRKSSWDIALKAIREDARERAEQYRRDGGGARRTDEPFDARRRALCRLSEDFLRHVWKADQQNLMGLIQDFGTEAWSENWADFKSESLGEMLDLSDSQRQAVQAGYDSLWRQHGPRLQRLLAADQTDHEALLRAAQEYFKAEDQLIGSVLGNEAQSQYGDSEIQIRTLVLGILGTFADKPWSDALAW